MSGIAMPIPAYLPQLDISFFDDLGDHHGVKKRGTNRQARGNQGHPGAFLRHPIIIVAVPSTRGDLPGPGPTFLGTAPRLLVGQGLSIREVPDRYRHGAPTLWEECMRVLIASALSASVMLVSLGAHACFGRKGYSHAAPGKMSRVAEKKPAAATPAPKWGTKQMYGR
jgi:hypothetical protein